MLNIFTARENIDTKRFMFERIAHAMRSDVSRRVFLIVPEQSTLQAEAEAFDYMDVPGFIDFDVLSMTSLGRRIIDEVGRKNPIDGVGRKGVDSPGKLPEFISKYGKYMILSRLMYKHGKDMHTFRRAAPSPDFIEKLSNTIAEMKNHNISPGALSDIISGMKSESILKRKLEDTSLIYDGYEKAIAGKYIDVTGHLKLYTSMMKESSFIRSAAFWMHGFDYLSPAVMDAVTELACYAKSVNIVLTGDMGAGADARSSGDSNAEIARKSEGSETYCSKTALPDLCKPRDPLFTLTGKLASELARRAEDANIRFDLHCIPVSESSGYKRRLPPQIAHIERAMFTRSHTPHEATDKTPAHPHIPTLRFIAAANYYTEAETAAAEISGLIQDGADLPGIGHVDFRYRDILVLCNDMAERGTIIRRVFQRYGLPVFMDRRRSVEHNPVIEYILAIIMVASGGRMYEDVFRLLKTGLTGIGADEIDELENYAIRYNIRGKRWERACGAENGKVADRENPENETHTGSSFASVEYNEEEFLALNTARAKIVCLIKDFEKGFKSVKTASERTTALSNFLIKRARLPGMIAEYTAELEEAGRLDYAAEMSGIWDMVLEVFEQMKTILGDIRMSMKEYVTVLRTGLESIRIGVLPTALDQIVLGTMQRTRSGRAKAVYVLGANDGVLPASVGVSGILSEDESVRLADSGYVVARSEETMHMEEELAMYRNFAKPEMLIRVGYASSDSSGGDLRPSPIFLRLCKLFPEVPVEKDIRNANTDFVAYSHIRNPNQAVDYLAERMRAYIEGEVMPEVWKQVYRWYGKHKPADLARVKSGLTFRGRRERVDARYVDGLYRDKISPSALEKYSRCPFSWFMDYVLNLTERRVFGTDSRSIGEIYHGVLMRYGRELSSDGLSVSDGNSRWQNIADDEITALISRLTEEEYERIEHYRASSGSGAPDSNGVEIDNDDDHATDVEKTETSNNMENYRTQDEPTGVAEDTFIDIETRDRVSEFAEASAESYRLDRVKRTAIQTARAITRQVRESRVENIFFESTFGGCGDFPPIVSRRVGGMSIEGRIDRVDVMDGGYARIIDYKSGAAEFSAPDAENGYQLQLMIYLQAVAEKYKPAGVFYFHIKEPRIEDSGGADVLAEVKKSMKLSGVTVNDERVLSAMGIDSGGKISKSRMEQSEFTALRAAVSDIIEQLTIDISSGDIGANPKVAKALKGGNTGNQRACQYCRYKGACNYDNIIYGGGHG